MRALHRFSCGLAVASLAWTVVVIGFVAGYPGGSTMDQSPSGAHTVLTVAKYLNVGLGLSDGVLTSAITGLGTTVSRIIMSQGFKTSDTAGMLIDGSIYQTLAKPGGLAVRYTSGAVGEADEAGNVAATGVRLWADANAEQGGTYTIKGQFYRRVAKSLNEAVYGTDASGIPISPLEPTFSKTNADYRSAEKDMFRLQVSNPKLASSMAVLPLDATKIKTAIEKIIEATRFTAGSGTAATLVPASDKYEALKNAINGQGGWLSWYMPGQDLATPAAFFQMRIIGGGTVATATSASGNGAVFELKVTPVVQPLRIGTMLNELNKDNLLLDDVGCGALKDYLGGATTCVAGMTSNKFFINVKGTAGGLVVVPAAYANYVTGISFFSWKLQSTLGGVFSRSTGFESLYLPTLVAGSVASANLGKNSIDDDGAAVPAAQLAGKAWKGVAVSYKSDTTWEATGVSKTAAPIPATIAYPAVNRVINSVYLNTIEPSTDELTAFAAAMNKSAEALEGSGNIKIFGADVTKIAVEAHVGASDSFGQVTLTLKRHTTEARVYGAVSLTLPKSGPLDTILAWRLMMAAPPKTGVMKLGFSDPIYAKIQSSFTRQMILALGNNGGFDSATFGTDMMCSDGEKKALTADVIVMKKMENGVEVTFRKKSIADTADLATSGTSCTVASLGAAYCQNKSNSIDLLPMYKLATGSDPLNVTADGFFEGKHLSVSARLETTTLESFRFVLKITNGVQLGSRYFDAALRWGQKYQEGLPGCPVGTQFLYNAEHMGPFEAGLKEVVSSTILLASILTDEEMKKPIKVGLIAGTPGATANGVLVTTTSVSTSTFDYTADGGGVSVRIMKRDYTAATFEAQFNVWNGKGAEGAIKGDTTSSAMSLFASFTEEYSALGLYGLAVANKALTDAVFPVATADKNYLISEVTDKARLAHAITMDINFGVNGIASITLGESGITVKIAGVKSSELDYIKVESWATAVELYKLNRPTGSEAFNPDLDEWQKIDNVQSLQQFVVVLGSLSRTIAIYSEITKLDATKTKAFIPYDSIYFDGGATESSGLLFSSVNAIDITGTSLEVAHALTAPADAIVITGGAPGMGKALSDILRHAVMYDAPIYSVISGMTNSQLLGLVKRVAVQLAKTKSTKSTFKFRGDKLQLDGKAPLVVKMVSEGPTSHMTYQGAGQAITRYNAVYLPTATVPVDASVLKLVPTLKSDVPKNVDFSFVRAHRAIDGAVRMVVDKPTTAADQAVDYSGNFLKASQGYTATAGIDAQVTAVDEFILGDGVSKSVEISAYVSLMASAINDLALYGNEEELQVASLKPILENDLKLGALDWRISARVLNLDVRSVESENPYNPSTRAQRGVLTFEAESKKMAVALTGVDKDRMGLRSHFNEFVGSALTKSSQALTVQDKIDYLVDVTVGLWTFGLVSTQAATYRGLATPKAAETTDPKKKDPAAKDPAAKDPAVRTLQGSSGKDSLEKKDPENDTSEKKTPGKTTPDKPPPPPAGGVECGRIFVDIKQLGATTVVVPPPPKVLPPGSTPPPGPDGLNIKICEGQSGRITTKMSYGPKIADATDAATLPGFYKRIVSLLVIGGERRAATEVQLRGALSFVLMAAKTGDLEMKPGAPFKVFAQATTGEVADTAAAAALSLSVHKGEWTGVFETLQNDFARLAGWKLDAVLPDAMKNEIRSYMMAKYLLGTGLSVIQTGSLLIPREHPPSAGPDGTFKYLCLSPNYVGAPWSDTFVPVPEEITNAAGYVYVENRVDFTSKTPGVNKGIQLANITFTKIDAAKTKTIPVQHLDDKDWIAILSNLSTKKGAFVVIDVDRTWEELVADVVDSYISAEADWKVPAFHVPAVPLDSEIGPFDFVRFAGSLVLHKDKSAITVEVKNFFRGPNWLLENYLDPFASIALSRLLTTLRYTPASKPDDKEDNAAAVRIGLRGGLPVVAFGSASWRNAKEAAMLYAVRSASSLGRPNTPETRVALFTDDYDTSPVGKRQTPAIINALYQPTSDVLLLTLDHRLGHWSSFRRTKYLPTHAASRVTAATNAFSAQHLGYDLNFQMEEDMYGVYRTILDMLLRRGGKNIVPGQRVFFGVDGWTIGVKICPVDGGIYVTAHGPGGNGAERWRPAITPVIAAGLIGLLGFLIG